MLINHCPLSFETLTRLLYPSLRIISEQLRATLELRDKMVCTCSNTSVEQEVW